MFVKSIILNNFRAYKNENIISFKQGDKNIFIVAGNNGFGKTTFLTSLIWCMYGKLMVDVDDKFRKEINESQGYKNFATQNLNKECYSELISIDLSKDQIKRIAKNGYSDVNNELMYNAQYSVSILLTDVLIPSIPCDEILIKRTYDCLTNNEKLEVLIDGQENVLAKEVGYDIFINDFILSKDIAKFFFFDAEKIVSLAEIRTNEEKRKLSLAYSEVLGIKKYEDIKRNLESLRLKLRRKSSDVVDRQKLEKSIKAVSKIENSLSLLEQQRISNNALIADLKDDLVINQTKLLRDGNTLSVEELNKQKDLLEVLREKDRVLKSKIKDMLELAPFAISGNLFKDLKNQVDAESIQAANLNYSADLNCKLIDFEKEVISRIQQIILSDSQKKQLEKIISEAMCNKLRQENLSAQEVKVLVDFSKKEVEEFQSLFDHVRFSYASEFKQLVKDDKNNSMFLSKILRKITHAQNIGYNKELKLIRDKVDWLQRELITLENTNLKISEQIGSLSKELIDQKKIFDTLQKKISIDDKDKDKDIIAERLIQELSSFVLNLKDKKKKSLEDRIMTEIRILMHKSNLISKIEVVIDEELIDIVLMSQSGVPINKESLSKGEQQLYATAILKALVDESEIDFPVFIDSPLQKFDEKHAKNIIEKFYPTISKQVVLFPLLGKELSEKEYISLLPNVSGVYIIKNNDNKSFFERIKPQSLFNS